MSSPDEDLVAFANARLGSVLRGKYRLDAVVGYGGMAVVFKATHRNQAELAVKVLHPKLARVNGVRDRFLREGYAANSVKHKGAVLVLDDDVDDDGSTFLVMELLDGQSCELIWQRRGGTFPLKSALTVAHEALDVLASAHARGIVHRDIKPANLFVTKAGGLKVLDFGIAKVLDAVSAQSTGRLPIGTPAFMSPEQALGESNDVGPKTDIWAMGATLFSLLSGELVHDAPTAHEILVKTATEPPRSLATVAPFLAKDVIELVDRALAVDPQKRWTSAVEMRDVAGRLHREFFREVPSSASLLELYGNDDIDTANAYDETVKELVPPKMSTPPPANRDTERPPASRRSSGRMRASPWTDEKKTAPRLSLVLDDTSVEEPMRLPVTSTPEGGSSFKGRTARLPAPSMAGGASSPGLPMSSPGVPSSSPGLPSSSPGVPIVTPPPMMGQLIPTSPSMRAASQRNVPTGPRQWPPPPDLGGPGASSSRGVGPLVAIALVVVVIAAAAGWWVTGRPAPNDPAAPATR